MTGERFPVTRPGREQENEQPSQRRARLGKVMIEAQWTMIGAFILLLMAAAIIAFAYYA